MGEPVSIPGAPDRDAMVAFQVALVERTRAILAFRIAERSGGNLDAARDVVKHWTAGVRTLISQFTFPFITMCDTLGVGQRHQDALAVIAAPHLDDTIRDDLAAFRGRRHVDAALVVELTSLNRAQAIAARSVFVDGGALHRAGLVESVPVSTSHVVSALEHELVPSPRLLRVLDGQVGLDPRFRGLATLVASDPWAGGGVVDSARIDEIASLVRSTEQAVGTLRGASMLLTGPHGIGKLRVARAVAARCGIGRLVVAETALLPAEVPRLQRTLEALSYEAELLGARLLLRGIEHRGDTPGNAAALLSILRNLEHVAWATSDTDPRVEHAAHLANVGALVIPVTLPGIALRADAWSIEANAAGLDLSEGRARELALDYPLPRSAIADVAAAFASASEQTPQLLAKLADSKMPGHLGRYAQRGSSRATLDNLVLTDYVRDQVTELYNAARYRRAVFDRWKILDRHSTGRGIVAMFNGPPGTGKTLCANAIANALGLPLYRIDTSTIVDRYVGETEKNLMRLFEEAAASRAALLFDEADSLFGKRIDAQDATDRHANMQINVLLNLIEDYDGFVVLTTNMKGALDSAFLRRIMFKINFELPELEERLALWRYHLPMDIPQAQDVDLAALAREFDRTSGGEIKNAVLRAVLMTRGEAPVTQAILHRSMASELRANGSVIVDSKGSSRPTSLV